MFICPDVKAFTCLMVLPYTSIMVAVVASLEMDKKLMVFDAGLGQILN
jgi:hypothetical protein